jgi:hypothetical protein
LGINLPPRFSWTLWLPCEGRKPGIGVESGVDTSAARNRGGRGADMGLAQRSVVGGAWRAAAHPPKSKGLWPGCWAWQSELGHEAKVGWCWAGEWADTEEEKKRRRK